LSKVKLGENYPRAERNTQRKMFKVIRSNTEIAITPLRIAQLRSNLVQSFIASQMMRWICSKLKVKGQGHGVKGQGHGVMYQQQKRYNTAMDRFSDFKLGMEL